MSAPTLRFEVAGVDAMLIRLGEAIDPALIPWVQAASLRLREQLGARLIEVVPSYTSIFVQYDLLQDDATSIRQALKAALEDLAPLPPEGARLHVIPVWYDPSVGPDLPRVAVRAQLSVEALIARHSAQDYTVFAVGFAPCFAYLGLLDEQLAMPRLTSPRARVPAGSLGIAERQTAIYPLASPGGWNLIGRTPVALFNAAEPASCRFAVGDRVRFVPIGRADYLALGGRLDDHP